MVDDFGIIVGSIVAITAVVYTIIIMGGQQFRLLLQVISFGFSRVGKAQMAKAPVPAAQKALEIFAAAFCLRSSFHCNGDQSGRGYSRYTYRPFTLEGNFAAAAGVQEMLLQSYSGTIRIFPAVPTAWRDVSFKTLRAEGAFLVSAERVDGRTVRIEIRAEKGGECRLENPFGDEEFNVTGLSRRDVRKREETLHFALKPDQAVIMLLSD